MTQTFPSVNPDYGLQRVNTPAIKTVQFGDGYQQRLVFGEGQNLRQYSLTFKNLTDSEAKSITDFLDDRADDGASFNWQPPEESSALKFVCPSWTRTTPYSGRASLSMTFKEVKEP